MKAVNGLLIIIMIIIGMFSLSSCGSIDDEISVVNRSGVSSVLSNYSDNIRIETFSYDKYEGNYYLVTLNDEGILVDAGYCAKEIIQTVKNNKFKIKYIFLTHGHFDHVEEVAELKKGLSAEVIIHANDEKLLKQTVNEGADTYLKGGEQFTVGGLNIEIIHTPGHTPGSISLKVGNMLFAGDTLFKESIGRTDFEGGNHTDIINSIKSKLLILDDNTEVFPGHGEKSSIGYEKRNNSFIQ